MYTTEELNLKLLSELRKIGIELGIKDLKNATKQDLIEKILERQANAPMPVFRTENAEDVAQKTVSVVLLDASTGNELAKLDAIEVAISM